MKLVPTITAILGVLLTTGVYAGYKASVCCNQPIVKTETSAPAMDDTELLTISALGVLIL
ncbi:MAG TPA: hypothetical protein VIK80_14030 [Flavihumibacter sp.]|jgi:hypothetical protein